MANMKSKTRLIKCCGEMWARNTKNIKDVLAITTGGHRFLRRSMRTPRRSRRPSYRETFPELEDEASGEPLGFAVSGNACRFNRSLQHPITNCYCNTSRRESISFHVWQEKRGASCALNFKHASQFLKRSKISSVQV
jgi:hypothetical protein